MSSRLTLAAGVLAGFAAAVAIASGPLHRTALEATAATAIAPPQPNSGLSATITRADAAGPTFAAMSVDLGFERPAESGGRRSGRMAASPITLVRELQPDSVALYRAMMTAAPIREATIMTAAPDRTGRMQPQFEVTLRNAMITSMHASISTDEDGRPTTIEKITFVPAQVIIRQDGRDEVSYDFEAGRAK